MVVRISDKKNYGKVTKLLVTPNKNMINTCKNCWAIRLCHSCYVDRYDTKGFRQGFSFNSCDNEREAVKNELILYHSLLENNPEKIEEISKIEIF